MMAGPCTVESNEQVSTIAAIMRECGIRVLRGGAFKPRTSPYSFQGMGEEGLKVLRTAADKNGLIVISEIMNQTQIPMFLEYVDILQVGARNMQNFDLLKELAKVRRPVLLKRGPSATIEEWLLSAEYIMSGGNHDVMLCERGIRTFENYTRNTLDISAIPVIKKLCGLTDGNLARHLEVLEASRLIEITKSTEDARRQSLCRITADGRKRFLGYLSVLEQVLLDANTSSESDEERVRLLHHLEAR